MRPVVHSTHGLFRVFPHYSIDLRSIRSEIALEAHAELFLPSGHLLQETSLARGGDRGKAATHQSRNKRNQPKAAVGRYILFVSDIAVGRTSHALRLEDPAMPEALLVLISELVHDASFLPSRRRHARRHLSVGSL
jgi:hypothetical protein